VTTPRSEPLIPDANGLIEGLQSAFALFASEVDLGHAVGETGVLRGQVEIFLEKGRGKHYKGSVSFERRMESRRG
jgi:hypothetical protein